MQISNYNLQLQSSFDNFDSQAVLSNTNNLQSLEAALTSMLQKDSITTGSVVQIITPTIKRRQTLNSFTITCNLNVTSSKPCSSTTCLNQFQSHVNTSLSGSNETTPSVYYQQTNSSQTYWLYYYLPQTIQSSKILY